VIEGMTEPVQVTAISAGAVSGGVRVAWDVNRDVVIAGYRVYRREVDSGDPEVALNPGALIHHATREYVDMEDLPVSTEYEYVVAAVLGDDSVVRSEAVTYATAPPALALAQNYPNPFNPGTTISFDLPAVQRVKLSVYDSAGRRVGTVVDAELGPGPHAYTWPGKGEDGGQLASGVYFYRLETPRGVLTRKMVHIK
jgi:hypothetical protein